MSNEDADTSTVDTTDTDDTTTDDQDTAGDTDDWKPPTKADWDAVQAALTKARREARAAKRKPAGTGSNGDATTAEKPDPEKAAAEATAAAENKWKPLLVRTAARTAFVEAGLVLPKSNADGAMARVVKLLDLDDLEITDDGQVDGLREQVEEIRADFPELFATGGKARTGRVDGADKGSQGNGRAKTASEIQAAALMGSR